MPMTTLTTQVASQPEEGTLGPLIGEVRSNIVSTGQKRNLVAGRGAAGRKYNKKGESKVQSRAQPSQVQSIQ